MSLTPQQLLERAMSHHQAGRLDQARELYDLLLQSDPDHAPALHFTGVIEHQQGRHDAARRLIEKAVAIQPNVAMFHHNLAHALRAGGDLPGAEQSFLRALALDPRLAPAHDSLGAVYLAQKKHADALACFERALALDPLLASGHAHRGNIFLKLGRPEEALVAFQRAFELRPDAEVRTNIAGAYVAQRRIAEAIEHLRGALQMNPLASEAGSNLLMVLHYADDIDPRSIHAEHVAWGGRFAAALRPSISSRTRQRLRIGYVSGDLRDHPVGTLIEPILEHRDCRRFEVVCYPSGVVQDHVSARLRGLVDHWTDITHLSDDQAAERIRADGIDILVDLSGHTDRTRLSLFSRRPAPVQASYLGYPDTTGLPTIDYRITDALADPPSADALHVEKLIRLPGGFLCFRPHADAPAISPPPAAGGGGITFGSFNYMLKLSDATLRLWARVLDAVPGSTLLVKSPTLLGVPSVAAWRQTFARHGISTERLRLQPPTTKYVDHLSMYGQVDIALDPLPYNGTTTTLEALFMGVPVITLPGQTHASRVGLSILTYAGVSECIARDVNDYVRLAAERASDIPRLEKFRTELRPRLLASPLCDEEGFTRKLEAAYEQMWAEVISTA